MPIKGFDYKEEDSLEQILSDYEKREQKYKNEKIFEKRKHRIKRRIKKIFLMAEILVLILATARLLHILTSKIGVIDTPKYWAIGKKHFSDARTERCVGNLWELRQAVDSYFAGNKSLPDDIGQLCAGGYLEEEPVCPVTGKKYIIKEKGNELVYACPNPGEHGAREIWMYIKNGPPVFDDKVGK
jgi:hypothetical protein